MTRGIILVNTGSPASNNKEDVKTFIGDMLSDPLVLTVPDWFREFLARKVIANFRGSSSTHHYSLVWGDDPNASPLKKNMQILAQRIEEEASIPVEIAMRYGNPSFSDALKNIQQKCSNLHEVLALPMFPQYAQSSYQTVVNEIGRLFYKQSYPFRLKIVEPYYDDPAYIEALAESLRPFVANDYDRLLFSFHSLPLSHEKSARERGKMFDYVYQIKETVRLVTKELQTDPQKNRIVYSSAIGKKWLEPSLTDTVKNYPSQGVKKVIAITPGFPVDNLETLFDIDIEARDLFMKNGGESFEFVPALNANEYWVNGLIKMLTRRV